jgi:HEAT repeat protein
MGSQVSREGSPNPGADESELASLEKRPLEVGDGPALARFLAHPAKLVRLRAASVLSDAIASDCAAAALVDDLFASAEIDVRWGAAFAAGRAGRTTERVVEVAVEALDVEDGDVRWAAASIVTREARGSASLRARLTNLSASGGPRSRKMALLCLAESGVKNGDLYRRALADADPFVRLAAVKSLARSGDASAESLAALRAASEGDEDVRVRRGATAVLSRLAPQPS